MTAAAGEAVEAAEAPGDETPVAQMGSSGDEGGGEEGGESEEPLEPSVQEGIGDNEDDASLGSFIAD